MTRDADYIELLQWALPRLGLRWPGFRRVRGQVCKRITKRLHELRLDDLGSYRRALERNPEEWKRLDAFCRITISRFFRDRAIFQRIGREILPELARRTAAGTLRCWSAGCASGEEPYTVMMVWRGWVSPAYLETRLTLVATEVDPDLLERARTGCYRASSLKELPNELRSGSLESRGDLHCVKDTLREGLEFRCQDLREIQPEGPFELVFCRNMAFSYFDEIAQRRALEAIGDRVPAGGFLVLGEHEGLPSGWDARWKADGRCVYRRR